MSEITIVERMYEEFNILIEFLNDKTELSLMNTAEENFRKSILMASASYFEDQIISIIIHYVNEKSQNNQLIVEFIKNKAIRRQYHTLFDWDSNNANQFFGLFGKSFSEFMKKEIKTDPKLENSIKAFIQIGSDRNRLVHQNYGTFVLEKTSREIIELYKEGKLFIKTLPIKLHECPVLDI